MNTPNEAPEDDEEKKPEEENNGELYKYGFYTPRILPEERLELDESLTTNLQADIDLITISIDDFLKREAEGQNHTWKQLLTHLRAITLATAAKATLIRTRSSVAKKINDITETEEWLKSLMDEE